MSSKVIEGVDAGCVVGIPAEGISIVGTSSFILQDGQEPRFPDALSGTRIAAEHWGQLNAIAIGVEKSLQ